MLDNTLAAFISAALAFLVSIGVWLVQRRRKSLRYTLTESDRFPFPDGGVGRFYTVDLWNTGTEAIKDTDLKIDFGEEVESARAEPPELLPELKTSTSQLASTIPLLNPGEHVRVTATVSNATATEAPRVSIRAVGVTAQATAARGSDAQTVGSLVWLLFAVALGLMGYATGGMSARTEMRVAEIEAQAADLDGSFESFSARTDRLSESLDDLDSLRASARQAAAEGEPTRQERIFVLLNQAGLSHVFPLLLSSVSDISYVNSAYFLFHLYLADPNRSVDYQAGLAAIGRAPTVTSASRGVAYYLLAKIAEQEGRMADASAQFEELRTTAPRMFTYLMAQDSAYDVDALRVSAEVLLTPYLVPN